MSFHIELDTSNKETLYASLNAALHSTLAAETDWLANLANASALIFHALPEVNWVGFYLFKNAELVLGPFQGKLACTRIKLGRGVCGTAARELKTQLVPDVEAFPGHIACDSASRSEIVIPIMVAGKLYGVLDIDSPVKSRFDLVDQKYLEESVRILEQYLKPLL